MAKDLAAGREKFASMPDVVSLHTTEICNLRCIMCRRSVEKGEQKLDRSRLADCLEQLFPTARLAIVAGFLGEPMLSDWDLIVAAADRHGVGIDLVTNGSMMDLDHYRRARPVLNRLNISVDSGRRETYERIRAGASFARLLRNLEAIREERKARPDGVWISLSAVVMRSNIDELPEFVGFAAAMGADEVVLQPLRHDSKRIPEEDPFIAPGRRVRMISGGDPSPYPKGSVELDHLLRAEAAVRSAAREHRINLSFNDFGMPPERMRPLDLRIPIDYDESSLCWNVARNFGLFPNGNVYPCCHPTDHVLGNVLRQSIREIWNGPGARALRRNHFSRRGTIFCRGCLHAPYLKNGPTGRLTAWMRRARMLANGGRDHFGRP